MRPATTNDRSEGKSPGRNATDRDSSVRHSPDRESSESDSPDRESSDHGSSGGTSLWFLLSPRWILFHAVVIGGIVAMVNLGFWQLRRLDQRKEHNAAIEARYDAPIRPLADILPAEAAFKPDDPRLAELEWRPVEVSGEYGSPQVKIVNRSQDGAPGWQALSPLLTDDGRVLLVNRGFVPLDDTDVAMPTGTVRVEGHLRLSQTRYFGALSDPETGVLTEAQRIDVTRLSAQYDGPVVPMYLELSASTPDGVVDGVPAPVHPPTIDEGSHLSYALQWFSFSAAVAVGWVLAVRHSIAKRRAERR